MMKYVVKFSSKFHTQVRFSTYVVQLRVQLAIHIVYQGSFLIMYTNYFVHQYKNDFYYLPKLVFRLVKKPLLRHRVRHLIRKNICKECIIKSALENIIPRGNCFVTIANVDGFSRTVSLKRIAHNRPCKQNSMGVFFITESCLKIYSICS